MLHQLQLRRQILIDLATQYLEPMSGVFERLSYLAGLRDCSSGIYTHDQLSSVYGEQPVNEALAKAHEEVFEGLLETSLALQEKDLRSFWNSERGAAQKNRNDIDDAVQNLMPADAPLYLKNLFRSNMSALRELLQEPPQFRSDS
jgi:hypothetical protein